MLSVLSEVEVSVAVGREYSSSVVNSIFSSEEVFSDSDLEEQAAKSTRADAAAMVRILFFMS